LFKIKHIINAIVGHEMMKQKKKEEEEEEEVVLLYRATADWYWEVKSSSDFRVTWEEFCVSRK
jgi:hypothetical protein